MTSTRSSGALDLMSFGFAIILGRSTVTGTSRDIYTGLYTSKWRHNNCGICNLISPVQIQRRSDIKNQILELVNESLLVVVL